MNRTVNQLVDRWFELIGFEEESKKIVMHYDHWRNAAAQANRLLSKMRKQYNSDVLTFCVLKYSLEAHLSVPITIKDAMSDEFKQVVSFYDEVGKSLHNEKVTQFRMSMEKFIARPDLIGECSDQSVCERIAEVGPLQDVGFECLRSSGKPVSPVMKIAKDIVIASSLGEMMLKTSDMADGTMVLGYIVREKDSEGFFSLLIRNNGNIVSANDRAVEKFFGQFDTLSRRNNRYTENKAFSFFPYTSVLDMTFVEDGVHDIVDTAKVRKENLSFDDLSIEEGMRFFIGCMLIQARLAGRTWGEKESLLSTELFRDNIPLLESKALVTAGNRSLIESYAARKIVIPDSEIIGPPSVKGCSMLSNTSPSLFKQWFRPDMADLREDYTEIMPEIRAKYPNELVGSEDEIKKAIVLYLRTGIQEKIQAEINRYFSEHNDGVDGIKAYRELFLKKKETVFRNLFPVLSDPKKWKEDKFEMYTKHLSRSGGSELQRTSNDFLPFNNPDLLVEKGSATWYRTLYLKDERGLCTMVFDWDPYDIDEICRVLEIGEEDLPKEMRGWSRNKNTRVGNSMLSVTDPLTSLQNGYTNSGWYNSLFSHPFSFVWAVSKATWNKLFLKNGDKSEVKK